MNNALRNSIARPSLRAAVNSQDLVIDSGAATSLRPVQPGHCLDFNGTTQYIDSLVGGSGGTINSVKMTFNPDSVTGGLFGCGATLTADKGLYVDMSAGAVRVFYSDGTTKANQTFTGITLVVGTWYECIFSWDGAASIPTLTVNGVDYFTPSAIAGWAGSSADNWTFGAYDGGAAGFYSGKIGFCSEGVQFQFNNDFSTGTTAINSLTGFGSSGNGTLVNGPTWTTDATLPFSALNQWGYGTYLNRTGVTSHVRYEGFTEPIHKMSLEVYLFADITTASNAETIVDFDTTSGENELKTGNATGTFANEVLTLRGSSTSILASSTDNLTAGYHFIELIFTDTWRFYVDGVLQAMAYNGTQSAIIPTEVDFGASSGGSDALLFLCRNLKLYDSSVDLSFHAGMSGIGDLTDVVGNLTPSLISGVETIYIPRDEATPANDAFGNALEWSGSAFPRRPVYRDSYGISPDGSNDYATTGIIPAASGSIEVTFRKGTSTNKFLFGARDSANTRAYVGYDSAKKPTGGVGAQSGLTIIGTTIMAVGAVYKTMLSWTGSVVTLNIDDVTEYTGAQSGVVGTVQDMYIGTFNDAGTPFATGYVNDEIFEIKVNGVTRYTCADGVGDTIHDVLGTHDATAVNASTATEGAGFWAGRIDGEANAHNINNGFSRRMLFDGVDDYVSFDLGTFNTSAWSVKATFAFNDLSSNQDIFSQAAGSGTGRAWVRIGTNGNATTFLGGAGSTVIAPSSTFAVGGVYVIELVYSLSPDTLTLIVDGVSQTPVSRTCEVSTGLFYLGTGHALGQYSSGTAYNATLNGSTYTGNGNTDADWEDTSVNEDDGTVNGSPALLRVPADSAAPTLDVYGDALTNPAVANSHNDAETTWDFENIGTGDTIAPETDHFANFDAVTFSDTNYSLGITSPIDSVFWRDISTVLKDRATGYGATLTGAGLVYANNYTDGERWNNLAPWDDDNIWND